jgi:hypothetical protein
MPPTAQKITYKERQNVFFKKNPYLTLFKIPVKKRIPKPKSMSSPGKTYTLNGSLLGPFSGPGLLLNDLKTNDNVVGWLRGILYTFFHRIYFKGGILWWVTARRKKSE